MNAPEQGLFTKFAVHRLDRRDGPGQKHDGCEYFVLDLSHDQHAIPALVAYADSCAPQFPQLAADLRAKVAQSLNAASEFVTVPETTLPNGLVVPSFQVARYLASKAPGDVPVSTPAGTPWVEIDYHEAREACARAGQNLITETQALALAWNISQQDANWSGGKVGSGLLYRGLHKGTVDAAMPGTYESGDAEERRWHVLSNGERVFDCDGNAYTWVFDDVQGDENGIVSRRFDKNSPSISTAPFPSCEKGMGWYPDGKSNWSGYALIRGGFWDSDDYAGAFNLRGDWPGYRYGGVGFRCTK